MTLTKTKPKRTTATHKRRLAQHHKRDEHYLRAYWPYVPIVALFVVGVILSNVVGGMHKGVLGYATDISISGLQSGTNDQRSSNGIAALTLNGTLNTAAQNKANDMVARDYWAHNTPDGQTPWTFMLAAGYSYNTAGENLAYGFSTSAGTITGWMNSPGHRANILNTSFTEVGFGIANSPNYVGNGPQTIVVAMYASPRGAPAPAPAPVVPQTPVAIKPTPTPAPTPVVTPTETPLTTDTPSSDTPAADEPTTPAPSNATSPSQPTPATETKTTQKEPPEQRVPQLQLVAGNWAPSWSMFATSLITVGGLFFVFFRHTLAWRRVLIKSERFVVNHPLLDIAVIGLVILSFILSQTSGLIR